MRFFWASNAEGKVPAIFPAAAILLFSLTLSLFYGGNAQGAKTLQQLIADAERVAKKAEPMAVDTTPVKGAAAEGRSIITTGTAGTTTAGSAVGPTAIAPALGTTTVAGTAMSRQANSIVNIAKTSKDTADEIARKADSEWRNHPLTQPPETKVLDAMMAGAKKVDLSGIGEGAIRNLATSYNDFMQLNRDATNSIAPAISASRQLNQMAGTNGLNNNNLGAAESSSNPLGAASSMAPLAAMAGGAGSGSGSNVGGSSADGNPNKPVSDVTKGLGLENQSPSNFNGSPITVAGTSNFNNNGSFAAEKNGAAPANGSPTKADKASEFGVGLGGNGVGKVTSLSDQLKAQFGGTGAASRMPSSGGETKGGAPGKGSSGSGSDFGVETGGSGSGAGAGVGLKETSDPLANKEGIKLSGTETDAEIAKLMEQMKGDLGGMANLDPAQQAMLAELKLKHPELAQMLAESGL